jgi:tRNA(adenine34) deaminase
MMNDNVSPFGLIQDKRFMRQALTLARKALAIDEVPIGALVVSPEGVILGRGYNKVTCTHSQTEHAEAVAIRRAGKKLGDWRLEGCWLYVTLQPCAMCMNLINLARLAGVVYGAESPLFGYHLDKGAGLRVYKRGALAIIGGVESDEAVQLLKQFFNEKRRMRDERKKQRVGKCQEEAP